MANSKYQERLTDEQRKTLDAAYKEHFGEDFRAMPEEQAAELKGHAERADRAMYPAPENPDRTAIAASGGLDPAIAKRAAVYRAWQNAELPPSVDETLAKRLDPSGQSPTLKKFREDQLAEWKNKTASRFDPLTSETLAKNVPASKQTEIEPEEFTAPAPKKAAASDSAASGARKASAPTPAPKRTQSDSQNPGREADELEEIFQNSIGQPVRRRGRQS